ncbi:DUF3709 domain-containing protein [Vibrio cholerae]|uniref:DUF3709 domain-containing protein n=1 Tax=Vibrio cholerae TaxID=666 RepID=UPI0028A89637|nr:DUF3709 domain-containing protein [Vibrio cholerae]
MSLLEVIVVGSSRFEQFGAFTYRLKVCRQLNIVLRCLMKRQCVCRCKFQCDCQFLWHFVLILSAIQYCLSLPNEAAMCLAP